MKLWDISDKLFAEEGIDSGFVQQTESLEEYYSGPMPGGGGNWSTANRRLRAYRVILCDGKKTIERAADTVHAALSAAFEALSRPVPAWVEKTKTFDEKAPTWGTPATLLRDALARTESEVPA